MQAQDILAYDFKVDGIYYNKLTDSTVEVTYGGEKEAATDSYTGSVTIPSTIVLDSVTYRVTSIGTCAFYKCSDLTSITIPDGVMSMGDCAFYDCI